MVAVVRGKVRVNIGKRFWRETIVMLMERMIVVMVVGNVQVNSCGGCKRASRGTIVMLMKRKIVVMVVEICR